VSAEIVTSAAVADRRVAEGTRGRRLLRRGLIVFSLFLLVVLLAGPYLVEHQRTQEAGNSFGVRPEGFRGALEVLGRLGYDTRRWMRSYAALHDEGPAVLLLLDPMPLRERPDEVLLEALVARLEAWVEAGGVLVYAPPGRRVLSILGRDIFQEADSPWALVETSAGHLDQLLRDRLLAGLPAVEHSPPEGTLDGDGPLDGLRAVLHRLPERVERGVLAYLAHGEAEGARLETFEEPEPDSPWSAWARRDGTQPLVLARRVGAGRVVAFSSAYCFANAALRHAGTARLVAETVAEASERGALPVYFDEYAHGLLEGRDVTRWVSDTPLGRVLATVVLGIAGLAWFGMVRFGPPRDPRPVPRRAREEFVLSLADLYQRERRHAMAARSVVQGLAEDLARARGLDRERGPAPSELEPLVGQAQDRPPGGDAALLAFTHRALEAWDRARRRLRGKEPDRPKGPHA